MFDLIRFFEKKEYVADFLNGDFYMNSIGHFWGLSSAVQNDIVEGIGESLDTKSFKNQYGENFIQVFEDHLLLPIMNRIEAMKYVHVCCLSLHEYDDNAKIVSKIPSEMRKMGNYAVRVKNVRVFVDRIFEKVKSKGLYGLMGPVDYHDPSEKNRYMDCFDKYVNHAFEKEWRFALIPDYNRARKLAAADENRIYDEHTIFKIGKINDIAEEIDIDLLFNNIGKLYSTSGTAYKVVDEMPISWEKRKVEIERMMNVGINIPYDVYPDRYVVWSPRESFRNKIMELDNGKMKPVFTIG